MLRATLEVYLLIFCGKIVSYLGLQCSEVWSRSTNSNVVKLTNHPMTSMANIILKCNFEVEILKHTTPHMVYKTVFIYLKYSFQQPFYVSIFVGESHRVTLM